MKKFMHMVKKNRNLEIFEYKFPGEIIRDIIINPVLLRVGFN